MSRVQNWFKPTARSFNPISRGCRFPSLPGGGVSDTPLGNQERSCFRPHVAKSYFETYKSYDHMQNFRPYLKNSVRYRDLKNLSL